MSLPGNIDPELLKDIFIVIITAIVGILIGIVSRVIKKKPVLEISKIWEQVWIWRHALYIQLQFNVWNGKSWWQRLSICEATNPKCHITTVEDGKVFEDGSAWVSEELETIIIPPKSFIHYTTPIFYAESKDTLLHIKVSCAEGIEISKTHKINIANAIPEEHLDPSIMNWIANEYPNWKKER